MSDFAALVSASTEVWGLKAGDGWALCSSIEFEETDVMPFFSSVDKARLLCTGSWSDYKPEAIALDAFLMDWLPGMHEDSAMVGLNWNADMEGAEVEPAELATAIEAATASTSRQRL